MMTEIPPAANPPSASAVQRAPRWMWIALVVSAAFNLIVLGMAAATYLHFRKGHGGPGAKVARFIEALPSERQSKLRAIFDDRRNRIRPMRRALRRARRRARDAFTADPFDRAALVDAYADAAQARMALTTARQKWSEGLAEAMTVDERREFLRIRRRHRGSRGRRHRDR